MNAILILALTASPAAPPKAYTTDPPCAWTNRVPAGCACGSSCACDSAAGACPAKCPVVSQVEYATAQDGTRLVRGSDGVYRATGAASDSRVLVCDGEKCKWVDAPAVKPAYLPSYSPAPATVSGGCANGQCAAPQSFRSQPRFAFPRK